MFEQTFKSVQEKLWKEEKCSSELDYTEQTSWLLFLKYLDDSEVTRKINAELTESEYHPLFAEPYRWSTWAAPKSPDEKIDYDRALTGPDLIEFVDGKLFPYLNNFKNTADDPLTLEYKIGAIFDEIRNKVTSGWALRDMLDLIDSLKFQSQDDKHELSDLYESKIQSMGNAGRNGGEYYTPRPLIRAMIEVTKPDLGETIYDGAVGSAGFLCEAFEYLSKKRPNTEQSNFLQKHTFFGKEKKSLAFIIGMMNMILHGIDAPNIVHTNTLSKNIDDIQNKDRYDIVLANPPFGGKENREVQENFPIRSGETAYLFLQHFIAHLKPGGRAAVIIKNTFLSNNDAKQLRKDLLHNCNLHTILICPQKVFTAGVSTVVLFFEKGASTHDIWYYELNPGRSLGKTNPLNDDDLKEFIEFQGNFSDSDKSWTINVKDVDDKTFDLSVNNPNKEEEAPLRDPQEILGEIAALDAESAEILEKIRGIL